MAALDLSGVTPEIPAGLAELVREIEGERILFDIGSAVLDGEARGGIGRVATSLQRLDAGVALIGARATLELIGRTDPTGSDSANQALSRERAETVVARPGGARSAHRRRPGERRRHQPPADREQPGRAGANQPKRLIRGEPQMIQKKVCMVGVFGTGKTSLVQRFVHSMFSERYLSTVGVKIDRKPIQLDGADLTLVLWDLAGRDGHEDITTSYLRGSHAVLYVAASSTPRSTGAGPPARSGRPSSPRRSSSPSGWARRRSSPPSCGR